MPFADHFSAHASDYARYRPTYPPQLFDWIAASAPGRGAAWDCGCGNGQATIPLAERFDVVFATDPSAEQIAQAPAHPRISWRVAPAEASGLDAASVDVVTVAQALHWFDLPRFWSEVRRVVRPGGSIVVWSYGIAFFDDAEATRILRHFHDDVMGSYWPIERGHVEAGYQSLDFPFGRLTAPAIGLDALWTVERMTGYLQTWSATRRYIKANGTDPVPAFMDTLRAWWGGGGREVHWPLTILAGRVQ
jgi:SAM-dependent methyltransferase